MNRLNRKVTVSYFLLLFILFLGFPATAASKPADPRIEIPDPVYDLGDVPMGGVLIHTFRVHNHGAADLKIERVRAKCRCTIATFDEIIPPGETGSITMEVDTSGFYTEAFETGARVSSNDPETPHVKIRVKATLLLPIDVSELQPRITGVAGRGKTEKVIDIRGLKSDPLRLTALTNSRPEAVDAALKPAEKEGAYQLVLTNKRSRPGRYRGLLSVQTNYEEYPVVRIAYQGDIRSAVEVNPHTLDFGRIDREDFMTGSCPSSMVRTITLMSNLDEPLDVTNVDLEASLFELVKTETVNPRILRFHLRPDGKKIKEGMNLDMLRISIANTGDRPLDVPVKLVLLPKS